MLYKIATKDDVEQIMNVISDVPISEQEKSRKIIEERISENQIICAISDDEVVGFVGWQTSFDGKPGNVYIEQITVKKDYRGKGMGQDLLKYFISYCKENKIEKIFARVQKRNSVSLNMFLKLGWVESSDPKFNVPDETFLEYKNLEKFEFWFRKEYKDLVSQKKLTQFVRPGVRKIPDPKGTRLGEKVLVRIVEVPSLVKEEAILSPLILDAEVTKLEPKKISDMTDDDFVGATLDASSQASVISQLERIYGKTFTLDDIVTVFKIEYK